MKKLFNYKILLLLALVATTALAGDRGEGFFRTALGDLVAVFKGGEVQPMSGTYVAVGTNSERWSAITGRKSWFTRSGRIVTVHAIVTATSTAGGLRHQLVVSTPTPLKFDGTGRSAGGVCEFGDGNTGDTDRTQAGQIQAFSASSVFCQIWPHTTSVAADVELVFMYEVGP